MNESDFILLSSLRPLYILLLLAFTYSLPPHLNHLFYLYKVNRPGSCCQLHYRPRYGSGTQQLLRVYTNMDSCHCLLHYRFHIFFRWARSSSTWEGIQTVVSPFSIYHYHNAHSYYLFTLLGFSIFTYWSFSGQLSGVACESL